MNKNHISRALSCKSQNVSTLYNVKAVPHPARSTICLLPHNVVFRSSPPLSLSLAAARLCWRAHMRKPGQNPSEEVDHSQSTGLYDSISAGSSSSACQVAVLSPRREGEGDPTNLKLRTSSGGLGSGFGNMERREGSVNVALLNPGQMANDSSSSSYTHFGKHRRKIAVRNSVAFFLLGLINNSSYVIMIALAKDIMPSAVGWVFLVNVLPTVVVKVSAPYW